MAAPPTPLKNLSDLLVPVGKTRRSSSLSTPRSKQRSGGSLSRRRSSSARRYAGHRNSSSSPSEDSDNASSAGSVYSRHNWEGSVTPAPNKTNASSQASVIGSRSDAKAPRGRRHSNQTLSSSDGIATIERHTCVTRIPPETAPTQIAKISVNVSAREPVLQSTKSVQFGANRSSRNCAVCWTMRPLVIHGWTKYAVPRGIRYYVNEETRAITDLDLRNTTKLNIVSDVLDASGGNPEGYEMWVCVGTNSKKSWWKRGASEPIVLWVDHRFRRILRKLSSDDYVSLGDDKLDNDYRYWTFIEMHPAHIPWEIVEGARKDAIWVLNQPATDHLDTPSRQQRIPPSLNQGERLKLLRLLEDPNYSVTAEYTRIVARILLHGVHQNQANFRPHKSLPHDISYQQPIVSTIFDVFLGSCFLAYPSSLLIGKDTMESLILKEAIVHKVLCHLLVLDHACPDCLMISISTRELDVISQIGGLIASFWY